PRSRPATPPARRCRQQARPRPAGRSAPRHRQPNCRARAGTYQCPENEAKSHNAAPSMGTALRISPKTAAPRDLLCVTRLSAVHAAKRPTVQSPNHTPNPTGPARPLCQNQASPPNIPPTQKPANGVQIEIRIRIHDPDRLERRVRRLTRYEHSTPPLTNP